MDSPVALALRLAALGQKVFPCTLDGRLLLTGAASKALATTDKTAICELWAGKPNTAVGVLDASAPNGWWRVGTEEDAEGPPPEDDEPFSDGPLSEDPFSDGPHPQQAPPPPPGPPPTPPAANPPARPSPSPRVDVADLKHHVAVDPEGSYRALGVAGSFRRIGEKLLATCPFHSDEHESLKIARPGDPHAGEWYCFVCAKGGDLLALVQQRDGCTFPEALEKTARELGVPMDEKPKGKGKAKPRELWRGHWDFPDGHGGTATHQRIDYDAEPPDNKKPWWERNGRNGLNPKGPDKKPLFPHVDLVDLPLYNVEKLATAADAAIVLLLEGEKKTDALVELIRTAPGGGPPIDDIAVVASCTGAGPTPNDEALGVLMGREVILWADNDDPGRRHMANIAARLQVLGAATVRVLTWPGATKKGDDAGNFVERGGTLAELRAMVEQAEEFVPGAEGEAPAGASEDGDKDRVTFPDPIPAGELLTKTFPELRWAVPDLLPEGLTLMLGRPKIGKSYLVLQLAQAVATGGHFLGRSPRQGRVLLVCLEDSPRRIQTRMREQGWTRQAEETAGFFFPETWMERGAAATQRLAETLQQGDYTLAVIDTLGVFLGVKDINDYASCTAELHTLQTCALRTRTAVVGLHHMGKTRTGDPVDDALGSTAIAAVADGVMGLYRSRADDPVWTVHIRGRDVADQEFAVTRDERTRTWHAATVEDQLKPDTLQEQVFDVLAGADDAMTAAQIIAALKLRDREAKRPKVVEALAKLVGMKAVERVPIRAGIGVEQPYKVRRWGP